MIVELSIGCATFLIVTLLISSRNEVRGWFLLRWLIRLLSMKFRRARNQTKIHTCRQYNSIRSNWSPGQCPARIHYQDAVEAGDDADSKASDDIKFLVCNSKGDWLCLGLQRSEHSNILLSIGLNDCGLFQHPKHPLGQIWARPGSFEAGDLKIELLEPRRKWRIAYNGWLRKGILNPSLAGIDESVGDFVHVRFYFIFEAYTDQFDVDVDVSAVARTYAYGITPLKKFLSCSRTDQYGEMHGHIWIDGDKRHVRMRGVKLRDHVPDVSLKSSVGRSTEEVSAMHYITLETGVAISVGLLNDEGMTSNVCLNFGYVMYPIGGWSTVETTNLNLMEFELDTMHMEYRFWFDAGGQKYNVHVTCQTSAVVYTESTVVCTRPFTVTVNDWKGQGILYVKQRNRGNFENRATTNQEPPGVVTSSPSLSNQNLVILPFSDPWCRCTELVGGKGASLAQLSQAGDMVRVPPGFCITVVGFQRHLATNEELNRKIEFLIQNSSSLDLEKLCVEATEVFVNSEICPDLNKEILESMATFFGEEWKTQSRLAVRSSAVGEDGSDLSCAGQMDTVLGVKGQNQLFSSIIKCWASQYSYQAVQYRRQHGQCIRTSMCVVIQEMVPAQISGVMFTRDPITGNPGRVTINTSYGLGEAIVSGLSEPDTLILSRSPAGDLVVESRVLGGKQVSMDMDDEGGMVSHDRQDGGDSCCIEDQTALKLGRIGLNLERHYGDGRDVEWAVHNDVIYVLQARPITSFDVFTDEECLEEFDSPISTDRVWITTGNIGEMSPGALTPLSMSSFLPAIEQFSNSLGPRKDAGLCYDIYSYVGRMIMSTANHLFINLFGLYQASEHHNFMASRQGAEAAVVGHVIDDVKDSEVLEYTGRSPLWKRIYHCYRQFKARSKAHDLTVDWERRLETYTIPGETARELYRNITEKLPDYIETWLDAGLCTSRSGVATSLLLTILADGKFDWRSEHFSDVALILEKCDNVYSADVPSAMRELSESIRERGDAEKFLNFSDQEAVAYLESGCSGRVRELYDQFMIKHGHRCIREAELREISWKAQPAKLIPSIKMMLKSGCTAIKERESRSPEETISLLKTRLKWSQKMILRRLIPWARKAVGEREWGKSLSVRMCDKFKQAYRRLGQSMTQEGYLPDEDLVFFLTHHELGVLLDRRPPNLVTRAVKRRRLLPRMTEINFPLLSTGHPEPLPKFQPQCTEGSVCLTGTPVSHGVIEGVARVVKTLPDAHLIEEGDILLVPYTDVGWTPYFPLISGLVTEIGSILSHGAVVAREYGLPCLVNCKGATDVFQSGDRILLDASQGILTKLD